MSPLAPMVTELPLWKNQTVRPLTTAMITETMRNRSTPRYAAATPSTNSGSELPSMCAQLACRNGALKMSPSRPALRGKIPYAWSSR